MSQKTTKPHMIIKCEPLTNFETDQFCHTCMFFMLRFVCVCWYCERASGQVWCVSTPPGSFLSNTAIKGGLLSDMSSPDVLLTNLSICVRRRTAGEEETHLSQEVKQECGRGEIGGGGKGLIPLVFLACNKKNVRCLRKPKIDWK